MFENIAWILSVILVVFILVMALVDSKFLSSTEFMITQTIMVLICMVLLVISVVTALVINPVSILLLVIYIALTAFSGAELIRKIT